MLNPMAVWYHDCIVKNAYTTSTFIPENVVHVFHELCLTNLVFTKKKIMYYWSFPYQSYLRTDFIIMFYSVKNLNLSKKGIKIVAAVLKTSRQKACNPLLLLNSGSHRLLDEEHILLESAAKAFFNIWDLFAHYLIQFVGWLTTHYMLQLFFFCGVWTQWRLAAAAVGVAFLFSLSADNRRRNFFSIYNNCPHNLRCFEQL